MSEYWYSEIKDHTFGMEPRTTGTGKDFRMQMPMYRSRNVYLIKTIFLLTNNRILKYDERVIKGTKIQAEIKRIHSKDNPRQRK